MSKCHVLSVSKKKKQIHCDYTFHGQVLEKVTEAKYLGMEIIEDLHWDVHIQATAAKANKTSALMHHNLKGILIMIQTNCYKGMVQPIMEYVAMCMWEPHQQYLSDSLEKV